MWSAATGELVQVLTDPEGEHVAVGYVAFSADGRRLVAVGGIDRAVVWGFPAEPQAVRAAWPEDGSGAGSVSHIGFSPGGLRLLGRDGRWVHFWRAETGEHIISLPLATNGIKFRPDGALLARTSTDLPMQPTFSYPDLDSSHTGILPKAFSRDGKQVLSASLKDQKTRIHDAETGAEIAVVGEVAGGVTAAAFSADGQQVVAGYHDGTMAAWHVADGEQVRFAGHERALRHVEFCDEGRYVVSTDWDGGVRVWDAETGEQAASFSVSVPEGSPAVMTLSPDGKRAAARGDHGSVEIWSLPTGVRLLTLREQTADVSDAAFSPDGLRLATCTADGVLIRTAWPWLEEPEEQARSPEEIEERRILEEKWEREALERTKREAAEYTWEHFGIRLGEVPDPLKTEYGLWTKRPVRVDAVRADGPLADVVEPGDIVLWFTSPLSLYLHLQGSGSAGWVLDVAAAGDPDVRARYHEYRQDQNRMPVRLFDPQTGEERTVDFPRHPHPGTR